MTTLHYMGILNSYYNEQHTTTTKKISIIGKAVSRTCLLPKVVVFILHMYWYWLLVSHCKQWDWGVNTSFLAYHYWYHSIYWYNLIYITCRVNFILRHLTLQSLVMCPLYMQYVSFLLCMASTLGMNYLETKSASQNST